MLEFFYDCKHSEMPISDALLRFTRVSDVDPDAPLMVLPHCDLVLTFDLSVPSVKDFRQSLGFYINSVFRKFLWKYHQELTIKPEDIPVFISEDGTLSFGSVLVRHVSGPLLPSNDPSVFASSVSLVDHGASLS